MASGAACVERIALRLIEDALRLVALLFRSTESVHAENSSCAFNWRCKSTAASSRDRRLAQRT
jgi:hypothetical protein